MTLIRYAVFRTLLSHECFLSAHEARQHRYGLQAVNDPVDFPILRIRAHIP